VAPAQVRWRQLADDLRAAAAEQTTHTDSQPLEICGRAARARAHVFRVAAGAAEHAGWVASEPVHLASMGLDVVPTAPHKGSLPGRRTVKRHGSVCRHPATPGQGGRGYGPAFGRRSESPLTFAACSAGA